MEKIVLARGASATLVLIVIVSGLLIMVGVFAYIAYPPLRASEAFLLLGVGGLPLCVVVQIALRRLLLAPLTLAQSLVLGAQPCLGVMGGFIGCALIINGWMDRTAPIDVHLPVLAKSTRSTKHGRMYIVSIDEPVPSQFGWIDHESVAITRTDFERIQVGETRVVLRYKPGFLSLPWRVHASLVMTNANISKEALDEAVEWSARFNLKSSGETSPPSSNIRREFYPGGQLRSEEPLINGQIEGMAKYQFANAQLYGKIFYKNGKKHGRFVLFHENGTKDQILSYRNGQMHGICEWFDESGHLVKRWIYIEGQPAQELPLTDGPD